MNKHEKTLVQVQRCRTAIRHLNTNFDSAGIPARAPGVSDRIRQIWPCYFSSPFMQLSTMVLHQLDYIIFTRKAIPIVFNITTHSWVKGCARCWPGVLYTVHSPTAKGNGFVFVSGQVPVDSNGKYLPVESSVTKKTHQIIQNVSNILGASGSSLDQAIKANVYFVQLDRDFPRNPARSSVEVSGLPKPADLEIEAIALES
ncbi:hypothetical protein PENFLA_c004G09026 [Penicillium flavigenum]|uniref:Uncharacterized protein n=1 Tax=Penicillium flavigenum TaxID=254877 RepID=A0A1V6TSZ5_9EURO|nr:hypothetical protein PENFLA_c004G09026 [Penicillium flavigenum]